MPTVTVNDIHLNYIQQGTGPIVLLVHAFPLDHTMWKQQIATLAEDHCVIAPDLCGFGQSSVRHGKVTMAQMADDLAALLDALELTGPITFCGLSMGGYIAWEMWANHPSWLKALILCDTRASADSPEVARGRELMANKVLHEGASGLADNMLPRLVAGETQKNHPALIDELRTTIAETSPVGIAAAQLGMASRRDFSESLANIELPCLVLCGREDAITTVDEMQAMAEQLPRADYVEVAGAGHLSACEKPQEVTTAIRQFLKQQQL